MSETADRDQSPSQEGFPTPVDETAAFASLLASGERVLLVRRRHWLTFVEAGRWFVLALLAGIGLMAVNSAVPDSGIAGPLSTLLGWAVWIFALVGIVGVAWNFLNWRAERYLVTTRRVIEAGGVINKYTRDTSLAMITDMLVSHPWLGRIFGYGEIDLLTASEAGTSKIRFLPEADAFKTALLDAKHEYELEVGGGRALQDAIAATTVQPTVAPTADRMTTDDLDSSLSHLAEMRERGLITQEEFDAKKRELLDRL
jgi:uncharacterized membrane protein YdbT with pleckstrin-like domain